jgi:hypothetical protein
VVIHILKGLWGRVLGRKPRAEADPQVSQYEVQCQSKGIILVRARGPQAQLAQVVFGLIQQFPSPLGLVLVEYRPQPREWLSAYMSRGRTLEALFRIRDLLGNAPMDLAIVSPPLGVEIIVDHLGVLEIRAAEWNEAMFRKALDDAHFSESPSLGRTPEQEPPHWRIHQERIRQFVVELRLKPAKADQEVSSQGLS